MEKANEPEFPVVCNDIFPAKALQRFWSKVNIAGPDECWEWQGKPSAQGYGVMCFDYKRWGSHVFAWICTKGLVPRGVDVCHTCDNRKCCNPQHFFLGTRSENIKDMWRKGRGSKAPIMRGPDNFNTKLTREKVIAIRQRVANDTRRGVMSQLAREHGVSFQAIWLIVKGKNWKMEEGQCHPSQRQSNQRYPA